MKPQRLIAVLPTLLTLGNAACGFGAITFAAKLGTAVAEPKHLFISGLLIYMAMLFDALDGSAARLMRQTSEIGAQLDSLCDAISFGLAPAFLMLQFVQFPDASPTTDSPSAWILRLLWTIGCLYALCALLRLARFNVESDEDDAHDEFSGLPSPAAAGTVAAFPVASQQLHELFKDSSQSWLQHPLPWMRFVLPLITISVAMLMVSRIPYPHFFTQLLRGQKPRMQIIQLVFGLAVVYWVHELAVPVIFCWFAFTAPLKCLWTEVVGRKIYRVEGEESGGLTG